MSVAAVDPIAIGFDPRLDAAVVRRVFQQSGRVHITHVLAAAAAERIHQALVAETPWGYAVGDEQGSRDLPAPGLDALSPAEQAAITDSTNRAAARGFAYRYSNFRIDESFEAGQHRDSFLMRVYAFLNSPQFLAFARVVTGVPQISYVDAQATLYRPGDFLTSHDDNVQGKHRHAAYVLSFSRDWRVEWGGLLAFPDGLGHIDEAFGPAFNALNLMRVPTVHTVTQVSSFAATGRYSITGWLRSRPR